MINAPAGIKKTHLPVQAAKPEFESTFFEEKPPALLQFAFRIGRRDHLDTDLRRDQINRVISSRGATLLRNPSHVGGLDSLLGLNRALRQTAPSGHFFMEKNCDFGLILSVSASWWWAYNDVSPAIGLQSIRQRRQQLILTNLCPGHAQYIRWHGGVCKRELGTRVTPLLKEGDAARSAPVLGRRNVEMSIRPGNTGALARLVVAAPGDGRTPPPKTEHLRTRQRTIHLRAFRRVPFRAESAAVCPLT